MPENTPSEHNPSNNASGSIQEEPTDNPLAGGLSISVYVPETIEIKMVDASVLSEYEIWVFIASILASATVGFWVSYTQAVDANSPNKYYVLHMTQILGGLFFVAIIRALIKRSSLSRKSKTIKLRVTNI